MVYTIHVPVKRPGPYVVRAAVRDAATEGSGSAQEYVEVPDLENGHLALSGIVLQEAAAPAGEDLPAAPALQAPGQDFTRGAARRSFRPGTRLVYGYEIMNATAGAGGHGALEGQLRLFHGGEQVLSDDATLPAAGGEGQRVQAGGRLSLGRNMPPGEYVLQIIVTDRLGRSKFNRAVQTLDFEVEP